MVGDVWFILGNYFSDYCSYELPLYFKSVVNLFRKKDFVAQSNSGGQFLNLMRPSSTRMDLFLGTEKADFADFLNKFV